MNISNDDLEMIKKFEEIFHRGNYVNSGQFQDVYNRVFNVKLAPTQCGSCLRQRCQQLINAMHNFENQKKAEKDRENNVQPTEEKKKVGRPKKTQS